MKNVKHICYFIIAILAISVFSGKKDTVYAQEIAQPITPHLYDFFDYEYQGNLMTFRIQKLPEGSNQGIAELLFMKSSPDLSPELTIPTEVSYLGGTYKMNNINLLFHISKYVTIAHVPDSITSFPGSAFNNSPSLTEITIPDTITTIGPSAFAGCTSLTSIKLPKGLTVIWEDTFRGCTNLENVILPEGLTEIGRRAFKDCSKLSTLYLPDSITEIHPLAFEGSATTLIVDQDSYAAYFCKTNVLPCSYSSNISTSDIPLDRITMKQRTLSLRSEKNSTLSVQFYPVDTTVSKAITWTSSDPATASVDQNGSVTAVRPGSATITASVGNKSAKCIVTVSPYSPKSVVAVPSAIDRITISWKSVKYAKGYHIYRSTDKTSGFKDIAYVNATSYEDYDLNSKTTYYYKVLASNNSSKSSFSEVVGAQPKLTAPKITASSVGKNSIKLHWNYVRGAEGYCIYRSTSKKGSYKLYKTVTTPYFIDASVTKDKIYYYNVKAYYMDKSKKIYSELSNSEHAVARTPATPKYVTLGTSKADVYKILGKPSYTDSYNYDGMYFRELFYEKEPWSVSTETAVFYLKQIDNEWVVFGWADLYSGLKVSDGDETNSGTFTLGSTFEDVIKAMKTPKYFEMYGAVSYDYVYQTNWIEYADGSIVIFGDDKRVIGWENKGCLKIKYGAAKPSHKTITLGSSLSEVLDAFGTPDQIGPNDSVSPATLCYGDTTLTFNEYQKLVGWENKGKLNLSIGTKPKIVSKVRIGFTVEEVVKAMGTPDTYYIDQQDQKTLRYLLYGKTLLDFDENNFVKHIGKK